MSKLPASAIPSDRLQLISSELRSHAPQLAGRLAQVKTEQDLGDFACRLFNLSHWIPSEKRAPFKAEPLSARIKLHISSNLHRGLTLKVLANFFGYSENITPICFRTSWENRFPATSSGAESNEPAHCWRRPIRNWLTSRRRWGSAIKLSSAIFSNVPPDILPWNSESGRAADSNDNPSLFHRSNCMVRTIPCGPEYFLHPCRRWAATLK